MAAEPTINLTVPSGFLDEKALEALTQARWAIYGRNGRGKTWFLRSLPADQRWLYVTVGHERGIRALLPFLRTKENPDGHIIPYVLNRWSDLVRLLDVVDGLISRGVLHGVAWDTWSRVQDLALGKILNYEPISAGSEKDYADRIPKNPKGWEGWEQTGALTSEWMRYFNRRPVHMVYLLQENDRQQQYDENVQTGVRLTPSAFRALYDDLELVGRLYVDVGGVEMQGDATPEANTGGGLDAVLGNAADPHRKSIDPNAKEVRKLFIGAHERFWCKGNTAILGRVIEDPTWDKLARSLRPTA